MATRAGANALGMGDDTGDFTPGKAADFVCLRPAPGTVLEEVVQHASDLQQALSAMVTMAGSESVLEVRVAGDVVFAQGAR
jgi:guanine deaminase